MVHVNELNFKAAETEHVTGLFRKDLRMIQQIVFFELELDNRSREGCGIDRHVDFFQDMRNRADMVLVTVRDDHAANAVAVVLQIGDIRNDAVNAVKLSVRKSHTAVDEKDIFAVLINGQVFSDLTQTAQRNDFQFRCHKYSFFDPV